MGIEENAVAGAEAREGGFLRSRAFTFIRIAISLAVVAGLIYKLSPEKLLDTLRDADVPLLVAAFGLLMMSQLLVIVKWAALLRARDVHVGPLLLARCYSIAIILSTVLPTAIGGDVYRIYRVQRQPGVRAGDVTMSVLFERATGYFALTVFGALGAAFYYGQAWVGFAALAGGAVGGAVMLLMVRRMPFPALRQDHFLRNLLAHRRELIAVYEMAMFSLLIQVFLISSVAVAGRAFGAHVGWGFWAFTIWVVSMAVLLPITIGGLGVRESSYSALVKHAGATAAQGASTGFVLALLQTLACLVILGGVEAAERLGYAPRAAVDAQAAEARG